MTQPPSLAELEPLLREWSAGSTTARDQLFPLVYPDLKRIASRHLQSEVDHHTLNTTALVHEACIDLFGRTVPEWQGRAQFFAFMSTVMRHVLVDHARRRRASKREGERIRVALPDEITGPTTDPLALLDIENALQRLTVHAPRMARVVECRLFGGMSDAEIADALGMSERTVAREWQRGRAWMQVALDEDTVTGE